MLLSTIRGVDPAHKDFVSPKSPDDFDTVWGFLVRNEPHVLTLMQDPVMSLLADQDRAKLRAEALGLGCIPIEAPPALQERGIKEVLAFHPAVLHEVFPTNP